MNRSVYIFTDGGARGNPGPAAIGVYIVDEKHKPLAKIGKRIGSDTNNAAEYRAVLEAFRWLEENRALLTDVSHVSFFLDSELVTRQINGVYKVKNQTLTRFAFEISQKRRTLPFSFSFSHVRREQNRIADSLVNLALDNKM